MPESTVGTLPRQIVSFSLGEERSAAKHRDELLRTWLVKFSANHQAQGKEPAVTEKTLPIFVQLWAEEFSDIPTDALESAFRATIRTIRFFPTVADIRAQIDQANAGGFALEAEQAWEKVLDYAREYWIPDQGLKRGAPRLTPAIESAVRAAGDLRWLESCPQSELQWANKRFLETYTNLHETGQVEHLLTRPEAKEILDALRASPLALPALPPEPPPPSEAAPQETRDKLRELAGNEPAIPEPTIYVQPTEEEWRQAQQRVAAQQDALRRQAGMTPEEWARAKAEARRKVG